MGRQPRLVGGQVRGRLRGSRRRETFQGKNQPSHMVYIVLT